MYSAVELRNGLTILILLSVLLNVSTVTVRPDLCPTNKIAPHGRRITNYSPHLRTLGYFAELFAHDDVGAGPYPGLPYPGPLQGIENEDDDDDCGEIEDYDEHDLSSLTHQSMRRRGHTYNRFFFNPFNFGGNRPPPPNNPNPVGGNNPGRPPYGQVPQKPQAPGQTPLYTTITGRPPRPPATQTSTNKPLPQTRPPTGGYFGNNFYRPPSHQAPSESLKPVHDGHSEQGVSYNPEIVGGAVGHIVGVRPNRPTRRPVTTNQSQQVATQTSQNYQTSNAADSSRKPRFSNTILGSFLDLLTK